MIYLFLNCIFHNLFLEIQLAGFQNDVFIYFNFSPIISISPKIWHCLMKIAEPWGSHSNYYKQLLQLWPHIKLLHNSVARKPLVTVLMDFVDQEFEQIIKGIKYLCSIIHGTSNWKIQRFGAKIIWRLAHSHVWRMKLVGDWL